MKLKHQKNKSDNIENTSTPEVTKTPQEEINVTEAMPRRSRLSKSSFRKSRNTMILSILGIIAILFLLLRYGIPLISDASFIVGRVTSSPDKKTITENDKFLATPDLDLPEKATKEDHITISGTSLGGDKVKIYVNGSFDSEADINEDRSFEVRIKLSEGENIIKAKAIKDNEESEFSDSVIVSYIKKGPELSIDSPTDGSEIKNTNPIEIKGKSDPDTTITVNDFQAVSSSDGAYTYLLTLRDGGNDIKVIAIDLAGNKTEKSIHVNYSH